MIKAQAEVYKNGARKPTKNIALIVFVAVFLLICIVPSAAMLILGPSEPAANEVLANPPQLTTPQGDFNINVLNDTSDYIEDRFAFRRELITAQASLYAKLFHSSIADDVTLGEKDWLFYTEAIEQFHGEHQLSELKLYSAAKNLTLIKEYAESKNATFLFTIAPNKVSLYPDRYKKNAENQSKNAERLMSALAENDVSTLDLFKVFSVEDEVLYFEQDSHWNSKGAALAHKSITSSLGLTTEDYYSLSAEKKQTHKGDLYEMLYPVGKELDWDYDYSESFNFTTEPENARVDAITINSQSDGDGELLMFRDSFGNNLYPFMAQSFGRATFSRSNPYKLALLEEQSADYVVIEIVERNINWLYENTPLMQAPLRDVMGEHAVNNLSVTAETAVAPEMPDYMKISGEIALEDEPSNATVYIVMGERTYEAFLNGEGESALAFSAYIKKEDCTPLMKVALETDKALSVSEQIGVNLEMR